MRSKYLVPLFALLVASMLSGCGKGLTTAPQTPGGGPGQNLDLNVTYQPLTRAAFTALTGRSVTPNSALDLTIGAVPAPEDSVFGEGTTFGAWTMDWTATKYLGHRLANGTFDQVNTITIPNMGAGYQFRLYYRHEGKQHPMGGVTTLNGVPITAWDYLSTGGYWTWYFTPPNTITSRDGRDETGRFFNSEVLADGFVAPDTSWNIRVGGADNMTIFSTDSWLMSSPMIFTDSTGTQRPAWHQPIAGFKAAPGPYYVRVNYQSGAMLLPGVNVKNADNTWTQCKNLADLDPGPSYYPVFELTIDASGVFHNPRNVDERTKDIVIGAASRVVPAATVQQWIKQKITAERAQRGMTVSRF